MAKLDKKLESKKVPPNIYLFHGTDSYSSFQKVRQWTEIFAEKYSPSGISKLDASSESFLCLLRQATESGSFFTVKRFIIVRGLFQAPAILQEKASDILDSNEPETFVILLEESPVKQNLKLYKKMLAWQKTGRAKIEAFEMPAGSELTRFMQSYVQKQKGIISSQACARLAVALGQDLAERVKTSRGYEAKQVYNLWQVTNELDKLLQYRNSQPIRPEDIETLVASKLSDNVFAISENLAARNSKNAMKYLNDFLHESIGDTEVRSRAIIAVGALGAQLRSLLQYRAVAEEGSGVGVGTRFGWTPYRTAAVARVSNMFTIIELGNAINQLSEIDSMLKSTSVSPRVVLSRFIVKVTSR